MSGKKQNIAKIFETGVNETTAHGLSRLVGERPLIIKVFWLIAFVSVLGIFLYQLSSFVLQVLDKPVSTEIRSASVPFRFPDIHVCGASIASASYAGSLSVAEKLYVDNLTLFLNKSIFEVNPIVTKDTIIYHVSKALMSTVPYKWLSNNFGHRKEQMFLSAILTPVNYHIEDSIKRLYHQKYLNCYTIQITNQSHQNLINSLIGGMSFVIYTDAAFKPTPTLFNEQIDIRGMTMGEYSSEVSAGVKMFFTPPNVYPDDHSENIFLSPNKHHQIKIKMTEILLDKSKGQCTERQDPVEYLNLYNGSKQFYDYSLSSCYYEVLNRFLVHQPCFVQDYFPKLYINKNTPNCLNFSDYINGHISAEKMKERLLLDMNAVRYLTDSVHQVAQECKLQIPCKQIEYSVSQSDLVFPLVEKITSGPIEYINMLKMYRESQNLSMPGYDYIWKSFKAVSNKSSPDYSLEKYIEFLDAAKESIIRVSLSPGEIASSAYHQHITYSWDTLIADTGGLLGFYMGCSVLTLMELFEFLFNLIRYRRVSRIVA